MITHLRLLDGDFGGFKVDRLTHSLQTATRAYRAGRDDEYVACALLHDIGDTLGSYNHADIAAAIVKPFVDETYHWMVEQHAIFQGYYFFHYLGLDRDMRDQFAGPPATTTSPPSSAPTSTSRRSIPTTRRCRSTSSSRCSASSSPLRSARSTSVTTGDPWSAPAGTGGLIFDCDGTLAHTMPCTSRCGPRRSPGTASP